MIYAGHAATYPHAAFVAAMHASLDCHHSSRATDATADARAGASARRSVAETIQTVRRDAHG